MSKPLRLAFSYTAFSTPQQSEGRSKDRQHGGADDWCARHAADGVRLAPSRQYCDEGVSRYNGRARMKGALSRFLKLCGTPAVPPGSILVIEDFDRLSRENADDAWELFRAILLKDVEIVVLNLDRWFKKDSLTKFEDRLLVQACQHRAHQESATKAKRQADIWADRRRRAAKEKGDGVGTKLPAWMRRNDEGEVELVPERAETIRLMAAWSLAGIGCGRIARRLTAGPDARPFWGKRGQWCDMTVKKILQRPAVYGAYQPAKMNERREMVPAGDLVRDFYPAAISEDEARRIHRGMASRSRRQGRVAKHDRNVMRYVARCAETGDFLRFKYSNGNVTPFIARRWQGGVQAVMPYATLEEIVLRVVEEWTPGALSDPNRGAAPDRTKELLKELKQIEDDRAAIKREIARPGRAASTAAILAGQLDELAAREAAANDAVAETGSGRPLGAALTACQSIVRALAGLSADKLPEARRRLNEHLQELLEGVWVYKARWTYRTGEVIVQVWPRVGQCRTARVLIGLPPKGWQPLDVAGADFRQGYPARLAPAKRGRKNATA